MLQHSTQHATKHRAQTQLLQTDMPEHHGLKQQLSLVSSQVFIVQQSPSGLEADIPMLIVKMFNVFSVNFL